MHIHFIPDVFVAQGQDTAQAGDGGMVAEQLAAVRAAMGRAAARAGLSARVGDRRGLPALRRAPAHLAAAGRGLRRRRSVVHGLARQALLPGAGLSFKPSPHGAITYQDPCRLGRWAGVYEPPRDLLKLIPETTLVEMERSRENSLCCGTTAWMECSGCSKSMQMERLNEAIQTGAEALITACPKCQIHLTCAESKTALELKIVDLYTYLLDQLEGEGSPEK